MADSLKKNYHHGDLPAELMKAAAQELAEFGAQHFSLRNVAQRAGVSRTAPYRHFASKEALLGALMLDGFRLLTRALKNADSETPGNSLDKIMGQCHAYLDFASAEPGKLGLMFSALGFSVLREKDPDGGMAAQTDFDPADYDAFGVLEARVTACLAEGSLDQRASAPAAAMVLWAGIHGIALLQGEKVIQNMAADRGLDNDSVLREILATHRFLIDCLA